ncbi:hypothetical protein L596_001225 [Steinernema carpocapsae]|uniref:Uncharacterized protein n=1 Tax=Steinernema carpocapsae TaxID=34508 RepID=A0A4U8UL65_STECR|nr:hypothetical protein L596_001225 [Steinernema carpocapsae]
MRPLFESFCVSRTWFIRSTTRTRKRFFAFRSTFSHFTIHSTSLGHDFVVALSENPKTGESCNKVAAAR